MAQAVIRDQSCRLAFTAPWVTQVRNAHDYLADLEAETPLYRQAPALVRHLENARYSTMREAVIDMYEHGVVGEADVNLATAWQADMAKAKNGARAQDDDAMKLVSYRHLLILMGKGVHLKGQITKVLANPSLSHVDLVVGIFDQPVESLECPATPDRVTCVNVAGTTWTSGRNMLAKAAYSRERSLDRRYSFWTFGDADINMLCIGGDGDCLSEYDAFLAALPAQVWMGALLVNGQWASTANAIMVELQAFDAAWNSMRREAVPVLLPYRTDQDSHSWWSSQAIFWNKLQCLAPYFAVAPLTIFYENPDHNEYPRNPRNIPEEQRIARQMMGRLSGDLPLASPEYFGDTKQERVRTLPWTDVDHSSTFGDTFERCAAEFAGEFYSFVL